MILSLSSEESLERGQQLGRCAKRVTRRDVEQYYKVKYAQIRKEINAGEQDNLNYKMCTFVIFLVLRDRDSIYMRIP